MLNIIKPPSNPHASHPKRPRYMAKWSTAKRVDWTYDPDNRMRFATIDDAHAAEEWIMDGVDYSIVRDEL